MNEAPCTQEIPSAYRAKIQEICADSIFNWISSVSQAGSLLLHSIYWA